MARTIQIKELVRLVNDLSRARLAMRLEGEDCDVSRFMPPQAAGEGDMAFLTNAAYAEAMKASKASVLIMRQEDAAALFGETLPARTILFCENPYAFFAFATQILTKAEVPVGIHPRAFVEEGAEVDPTATVEALAVVRAGAKVGARTVIKTGAVVAERVTVGEDCLLYPNAVLERDTVVGNRCVFQPGCVIGGDGFGFAPFKGEWVKIPQTGRVVIGDDVEVGANTTIDRGALEDTVIGTGTKLDNQIQIAHNDRIGEHCVMAACVGIAGSTTIGDHTMVGGAAMVNGHIDIPAGSVVGPSTVITGWGDKPCQRTGFFPSFEGKDFQLTAAMITRLPAMRKELKALTRRVEELSALIRSTEE